MNAFDWLEASALGQAVRAAGPWTYAALNTAHVAGVATLFGAILVLDLRLVGFRGREGWRAVASACVPVAGAGLALALPTGLCLLSVNASDYGDNPLLLVKFAAILLGVLNLALLHARPEWRRREVPRDEAAPSPRLALAGALSIASWSTALVCGRLIAYV